MTTTEITHATPAGFAASVDSRDSGTLIATQYLRSEIDVLLGGGQKFFDRHRRSDKRNLKGEFATAGYAVMENADALAVANTDRRWLGIFADSHLPYTIDQRANTRIQELVPTLPTMAGRALEWLGRHEHFILQIEGGRVDQAAHNCDAPAAMWEMIRFDEALDLVLEFQRQRPDTLVVVTTDHGTGNPGVNASGTAYNGSATAFKRVADVKASFAEIMRQFRRQPPAPLTVVAKDEDEAPANEASAKKTKPAPAPKEYVPSVKEIQEVMLATTGYKVSDRRAGWFRPYLEKKGVAVYEALNSEMVQLGQLLANHISVGWVSGSHTADFVPVMATGPGAERFGGFIQNTDIFHRYNDLAGIDFRNPKETYTAASKPWRGPAENTAEYALV